MSIREHICSVLERFESEKKYYDSYCYAEYYTDDYLVVVFSKVDLDVFMICIYGNDDEQPISRGEEDYFVKICKDESIYPYEEISYHAVTSDRLEGERYRDYADEIMSLMFKEMT